MPRPNTDSWRQTDALRALEDTISVYRAGATMLASRVSALRREVLRLRTELSGRSVESELSVSEVWLTLDADARQTASKAVARALGEALSPRVREDAALIAGELAADRRRARGIEVGGATLRVTYTPVWVRIELEHHAVDEAVLIGPPAADCGETFDLGLIPAISDRWGAERDAADRMHVWAQIGSRPAGG